MGTPIEMASLLANSVSAKNLRASSIAFLVLKNWLSEGADIATTAASMANTAIISSKVKPPQFPDLLRIRIEPVRDVIF